MQIYMYVCTRSFVYIYIYVCVDIYIHRVGVRVHPVAKSLTQPRRPFNTNTNPHLLQVTTPFTGCLFVLG